MLVLLKHSEKNFSISLNYWIISLFNSLFIIIELLQIFKLYDFENLEIFESFETSFNNTKNLYKPNIVSFISTVN